jgi:hypothetical protein
MRENGGTAPLIPNLGKRWRGVFSFMTVTFYFQRNSHLYIFGTCVDTAVSGATTRANSLAPADGHNVETAKRFKQTP